MEQPYAYTLQQKALLHDALMAGLAFEVAEVPLAYYAAPVPTPVAAAMIQNYQTLSQTAAEVKPTPLAIPEPAPACRIWQAGEAGGVLVVVGTESPPQGVALHLLHNMLCAVGLANLPLGFVGVVGVAPHGGVGPEVIAAATPLAAPFTLVLGQSVLAALSGKAMGVEGWQAAPQNLGFAGTVGVTYPLELLTSKPLFKGLAWQHLQRWKAGAQ